MLRIRKDGNIFLNLCISKVEILMQIFHSLLSQIEINKLEKNDKVGYSTLFIENEAEREKKEQN